MARTSPNFTELDPEAVRLGATVKAMREMRGMTQDQLSRAADMSRSYVANTERGRYLPSRRAIARLATALAVPQISLVRPEADEVAA